MNYMRSNQNVTDIDGLVQIRHNWSHVFLAFTHRYSDMAPRSWYRVIKDKVYYVYWHMRYQANRSTLFNLNCNHLSVL